MPYVQKEEDLEVNPTVQTDQRGTMALVPEAPLLLYVNMNFLQFQNPNIRIDNPTDDVVYVVSEVDGQLTIETVPIVGQGSTSLSRGVARNSGAAANIGTGRTDRRNSLHRAGVTAGLLFTATLLLLHGLSAESGDS